MEARVEARVEARTKGGEGTRRESEGACERETYKLRLRLAGYRPLALEVEAPLLEEYVHVAVGAARRRAER